MNNITLAVFFTLRVVNPKIADIDRKEQRAWSGRIGP